jgi:hypothetical protein
MRTSKMSKIEKLEVLVESRKDSKSFDYNEGHKGGLTNKEKLRKKNFLMVRKGKREITHKLKRSNSESRWAKTSQKELFGRDLRKKRRT